MKLGRRSAKGRRERLSTESPQLLPQTSEEWVIDALGCDPRALADLARLQDVCARVVHGLALNVVGQPLWHQFPPLSSLADPIENRPPLGGVTGLYLLSESHLACHTFPESGLATFNLYCCLKREPWDWEELLTQQLAATKVVVRTILRGADVLAERTRAAPGGKERP